MVLLSSPSAATPLPLENLRAERAIKITTECVFFPCAHLQLMGSMLSLISYNCNSLSTLLGKSLTSHKSNFEGKTEMGKWWIGGSKSCFQNPTEILRWMTGKAKSKRAEESTVTFSGNEEVWNLRSKLFLVWAVQLYTMQLFTLAGWRYKTFPVWCGTRGTARYLLGKQSASPTHHPSQDCSIFVSCQHRFSLTSI